MITSLNKVRFIDSILFVHTQSSSISLTTVHAVSNFVKVHLKYHTFLSLYSPACSHLWLVAGKSLTIPSSNALCWQSLVTATPLNTSVNTEQYGGEQYWTAVILNCCCPCNTYMCGTSVGFNDHALHICITGQSMFLCCRIQIQLSIPTNDQ